jgi:HlyD family secretion protein
MNPLRLVPPLPFIAAASLAMAIYFVSISLPVEVAAAPPFAPPEAPGETRLAAVGLIEPASEIIAIAPALSGLVTQVHVKPGDQVPAGAPLFSQDARDLEAELAVRVHELAQAQAALDQLHAAPRAETLPPLRAEVQAAEQALADAEVQLAMLKAVDDPRAVRREDLARRQIAVKAEAARLSAARSRLKLAEAGSWKAEISVAEAALALAGSRVAATEVSIDRLTVRAPVAGTVLKLNVRAGEYAQAGPLETPLITFGDVSHLHVRADVDEYEAWRLQQGAEATASPRGVALRSLPLEFVRIEPYVVPKRQLTGAVVERVDTRVVQVIYRLPAAAADLHVGQQMDVFIEVQAQTGDDRRIGVTP